MKLKITISAMMFAVLLFAGQGFAAKFRVNNSGVDADFTLLIHAHSAASPGDTIYVESSPLPYDNYLFITKRLVWIGTGYYLPENDSTQANAASCVIPHVTFEAGSAYSIMTGITVSEGLTIDDDNILIKRVRSAGVTIISGNNIVITQSVLNYFIFSNYIVNFQLTNSIVTGEGSIYSLYMNSDNTGTFVNNIIRGEHYIYNSLYQNNILEGTGAFFSANSAVKRNICSGEQYDTTGGNLRNIDMNTVFEYGSSPDGKYKLKAGSPAIGYGDGGVDCGIFGGNDPYVLSGMPTVPAIWQMNVNGTNVTVKAKSH